MEEVHSHLVELLTELFPLPYNLRAETPAFLQLVFPQPASSLQGYKWSTFCPSSSPPPPPPPLEVPPASPSLPFPTFLTPENTLPPSAAIIVHTHILRFFTTPASEKGGGGGILSHFGFPSLERPFPKSQFASAKSAWKTTRPNAFLPTTHTPFSLGSLGRMCAPGGEGGVPLSPPYLSVAA